MVDAGFTFKFLEVRALDLVGHAVGAPHSDVPRAVEVPEPTAAAALQKVFAALMMKQIVVASLRHPVRADTVNFGPVRWDGTEDTGLGDLLALVSRVNLRAPRAGNQHGDEQGGILATESHGFNRCRVEECRLD